MLQDAYRRRDVFLFPDEEGYLFVAANEAGRDEFERLFDAAVDWDFDRRRSSTFLTTGR